MINPQIRRAVLERFAAGESASDLAAEYGFDRSLIYKWRYRGHGLRGASEHGLRLQRELERLPPPACEARPASQTPMDQVRVAARHYAPRALDALAAVMDCSPNEATRIAAANAILDRAQRTRKPAAGPRANKPGPTRIEFVFVDPKR